MLIINHKEVDIWKIDYGNVEGKFQVSCGTYSILMCKIKSLPIGDFRCEKFALRNLKLKK